MNDLPNKYVLAFVFQEGDDEKVLLIEKKKPEWQKGKLNGIGGKQKFGEHPREAITRECEEETGLSIEPNDWTHYCTLKGPPEGPGDYGWEVKVFTAEADLLKVQQIEEETPIIRDSSQLPYNVIPNLRWLIPMAKCSHGTLANVIEW